MNADRYYDGESFPDDFFPGTDGEDDQQGGVGQDEIERTFELEEKDLNQRILFETVKSLERSVTNWPHLSSRTQRKMIKTQYYFYLDLIEGEDEDDLDPEEKE